MSGNVDLTLKRLYQELYDNFLRTKKKLIQNSLILSFFYINDKNRMPLLKQSSVPRYKLDKEALNDLLDNKLIREIGQRGHFSLTPKGVWEFETKNNVINDTILLSYLEERWFAFVKKTEKEITEQDKVILFSLIAARAFSLNSTVDLKFKNSPIKWKEVVDKVYEKLISLGLISKLTLNELYKAAENEDKIYYLFRHAGGLSPKTKNLYKSEGTKKYYLDIYKSDTISKEDLSYLFKRVFNHKNISLSIIDEVYGFCCNIAHKMDIYLFDIKKHIFSKPEYDEIIREALLSS